MLIFIGLFGLVASFHGIILAAGRAVLELGRVGYMHPSLGKVSPRFKTPQNALLFNLVIGIIALMTGKTGEIITIAVFGALVLYVISLITIFALRKNHPEMERPFKVPLYPVAPAVGLVIAVVALIAVTYYNQKLALIFAGIMVVAYGYFKLVAGRESLVEPIIIMPAQVEVEPVRIDD
jgi:ethanolamine permease